MIQLAGLHYQVRPVAESAVSLARQYGLDPRVTSTFRSWSEQARLRDRFERCVAEGRYPTPGTECAYPANRPGDSSHNWGLSFDSVVDFASPWWRRWWAGQGYTDPMKLWTLIREHHGFEVLPNDVIHAQVPDWRRYRPPGWESIRPRPG